MYPFANLLNHFLWNFFNYNNIIIIQLSSNSCDSSNFSDNELQTNYDDEGEFEEYDSGSQTLIANLPLYTAIIVCAITLVYVHE